MTITFSASLDPNKQVLMWTGSGDGVLKLDVPASDLPQLAKMLQFCRPSGSGVLLKVIIEPDKQ